MSAWVELAIPAVVVFTMIVVGLELTPADFRRVGARPKAVLVGLAGQLTLLPLLAATLIVTLDLTSDTVAGMLLLAACPAGGITNYFAYLARANTALSVTLTAVATVLAIVTMPLLLAAGFAFFPEAGGEIEIPVSQIIAQLIGILLLPIVAGMVVRHRWPTVVRGLEPRLRRLSVAAILGLVAFILHDQAAAMAGELGQVLPAAVLYTILAMLAGLAVGRASGLAAGDRFALLAEFSTRNLGIATIVAVSVLGRPSFLRFAVLLVVTSTLLVLLAIAGFRALGHGSPALSDAQN